VQLVLTACLAQPAQRSSAVHNIEHTLMISAQTNDAAAAAAILLIKKVNLPQSTAISHSSVILRLNAHLCL